LHSLKDSISIVDCLNHIGLLYYMKNPDSCFYYGVRTRAISARLHYVKGEAAAENLIAIAFFMKGLYRESLDLLGKVLTSYQSQKDTLRTAITLSNMSEVYIGFQDSTRGRIFCQRAIQIAGKLKQDSVLSTLYIGYCIRNRALREDSLHYYMDKAREIAKRYKDTGTLIFISLEQADYLLSKGHKAEALPLIRQSLIQAQNARLEYFEIGAFGMYGDYYTGQPDSVIYYYNRVYNILKTNGYTIYEVPVLRVILANAQLTGNKDKIITVQRQLTDALAAENKNLRKFIGDYVNYNNVISHNELLEAKNRNNKIKIWLLIGVCSAAALLIVFVYWLYHLTRKSNKQMQRTLSALEQSQSENTRMMQIVAHDLRNPIGGMYSLASVMLENESLTDEERMMLELIKTSGQNSLEMVSDLLQVNTRTEQLKKEPIDLKATLNYCVDLLRHKAEAKGQQLKLQTIPVTVSASREKLWRVVSNLIANAIKFSPTGAVIQVSLYKVNDRVRISVEDHGIGIPEEMRNKIFDMYTEAKRPGTAGEQPFGLGLAISKQIVEAHGGSIWFDSTPGEGTTFFVELPVS